MFKLFFATAAATFFAGWFFGEWGLWVTAVSILLFVGVWLLLSRSLVRIPDMQVGVVFNAEAQRFLRFLPPGRHWIMPFAERVGEPISTAPGTLQGSSKGVQVSGGIPLTIDWSLNFSLNPWRIAPEKAPKLALSLPRKTAVLSTRQMDNLFQHVLGEYSVEDLIQPGAHRRLERQVRQQAAVRLAPFGIEISQVMIGAMELPLPVQTALEAAQERRLHAENEALALTRLQQAVSQFSELDMQRLLELERIHRLGQNGVALWYSAVSDLSTYHEAQTPLARRRTVPLGQPFIMSAQ